MAEYDNTNKGALFRNDDKQEEDDRDYQGTINVGGKEYWLSAWIKTSKKGAKFMSLAVKPKEPRTQGRPAKTREDPDEAVPF